MSSKKNFNILPYLLIFLLTFSISNFFFAPKKAENQKGVTLELKSESYPLGKEVQFQLHNYSDKAISVPSSCALDWVQVMRYDKEKFVTQKMDWNPCPEKAKAWTLAPQESKTLSFKEVSHSLLGEMGRYRLEWPRSNATSEEEVTVISQEFTIEKAGLLRRFWQGVIYQPMLNALLALVAWAPNHNLGLSIILLTLFVRAILLIPSQRALLAQKRLTEVQPKLEALKEKYGTDQARLAQETMALWKEHKVNPLSSCLPLLIQIPFFLALFYVIQGGLSQDKIHLLYSFTPLFDLKQLDPHFLGLNLLEKNVFVLPVIVGLLQYFQISLTQSKAPKSSPAKKQKSVAKQEEQGFDFAKEMQNANKMMKYILPVMIAFLSASMAAGVGLYWATSNVFGIIQQLYVNRFGNTKKLSSSKKEDDVQIKVIRKP